MCNRDAESDAAAGVGVGVEQLDGNSTAVSSVARSSNQAPRSSIFGGEVFAYPPQIGLAVDAALEAAPEQYQTPEHPMSPPESQALRRTFGLGGAA